MSSDPTQHASLETALTALAADPEDAYAISQLDAFVSDGNGHARSLAEPMVQRALVDAMQLHRERGDFELCARLIDLQIASAVDDEQRAELYFDKARILADELLREADAVKAFERVLDLRPGDETAEDALGHISLVRDNWQKILSKYAAEAKGSTDRQLTGSLYLSIAELYAKYQPGAEVEQHLRKALETDPRNQKASLRLERLLRAGQRWDDLAHLFEQRAEAAPTREGRVLAYLALGDLERRRRGRPAEAAEAYKKVLGIEPNSASALAVVVEHYTEKGEWQALIRVYENALRARQHGDGELGTLLQIAMIWWKKLGNLEAAEEYWKKIRKVEPAHPAMLEFYRIYHEADAGKLVPILQQAQRTGDSGSGLATGGGSAGSSPGGSFDLSIETARAAERSKSPPERTIDLWKAVLRLSPMHPEAQNALARLYERTEKWNALLELHKEALEALTKSAADPATLVDTKIARLLQMVAIYRDRLGLDVMVINTYAQIVQLKPDHLAALQALAERYEALGRWNDLISVLQRRADLSGDAAEKAALLRRVADLWVDKFGNLHQAVRPLEELWALSPADTDVLARLRDLYTRRRSWRALLELERKEEERLAVSGTIAERRAKLVEIARLTAERLGDTKEAISAWNRLLELDAGDAEALSALVPLYEREKRWPALVEVLRRQAALAGPSVNDPTGDRARVTLLERAASILSERLSQPTLAADIYRDILALQPGHPRATRTLQALFAQEGRLDDLVALYGKNGQWDELYEVLQQTAERLPSTENARRIEMLSRAASTAHTQLHSQDKAARAYERILALDTEHGEATQAAARALLPIYRGSEKWARLLAIYEVLLGYATARDEQLALIREIRELCEEKLGSRGLAFSWAARAYALSPDDPTLGRELERLAELAETWDELAELYAREIGPEVPEERRLQRLRRLADLAGNRQHRVDDARKYYEQIRAIVPGDPDALGALEQLFAEGRSYPQLLAVYRQRESDWRGAAADPARVDLLFKIVWLEEEKLGDLDAARVTLRKLQHLEPGTATELRALRALERIESQGGAARATALSEILERQLALAEHDDARVELNSRLADLYAGQLARPGEALARLERASDLDPNRRSTHAAIERLLDAKGEHALGQADRIDALRLLIPAYEERLKSALGDDIGSTASRLLDLLGQRLAATTDPVGRLPLLLRLGHLADQLPDTPTLRQRRYAWGAERFLGDPASRELRNELVELGTRADKLDDVAVRLGEAETQAGDPALRRELGLALGALFEGPLAMHDEARATYRRILAATPGDTAAEAALERVYKAQGRHAELRELYVQRKERTLDAERRAELLVAISELDEGPLADRDAAIATWRELLELDPQATRAFQALDRLYLGAERYAELEALLAAREQRVPAASDGTATKESRAGHRFRRAELFRERLGDINRAVDLYEETLAAEPGHEGARRALELLLRRPEVRLRVARALQPIYEADEAWPKLALVLGAERESLEGPDVVALLQRLAVLQEERLGARQLALSTWREALRIDPRDERARTAVERLALLLGRHADLAAAWDEAYLASDPSDLPLRADLLARSARLYERELRDTQKAEAAWRRLFDLDPGNAELGGPAALALERLYESEEAWPRLVEVLRRQEQWASTSELRRQLLFRIARIQEELIVDPKAATATYRSILDAEPSDRNALDGLEKLHAAKGEWHELIEVLRRRFDLETAAQPRRDLLFRLAQLTERELADPAGAVLAYTAVLDEAPDDVAALDALGRLHEAAGRKVELLEVLERRIQLEAGRPESPSKGPKSPSRALVALHARAAGLDLELGRPEAALERYREILVLDGRHEGALRGVEQLLGDPSLRLRAAELLLPRYREANDTARLLSIHELLAEASPDLRDRISHLEAVAKLRATSGDRAAAFEALGKVARLAVAEPDLGILLDRLEAAVPPDARGRLAALYRELAPDILDASTQERVHLAVAFESERLGDRATAREYFRRVLDGSPDNLRALGALETIYAGGEEWSALYEIYVRRAELASHAGDGELRRRYLLLGAKLCETKLDRPLDAIPAYEEALTIQPVDLPTSRALEARYVAAARWHELADLLERRLGFADDLDEAVALRFQLARLFDTELADPERAVENYRATLGGDANHSEAIAALERYLEDPAQGPTVAEVLEPVYVGRHDWVRLVRVCEIRLEAADDARARLALRRRIARIYEEQLEDLDGAFVGYTRVYREDPTDRGTRDQLARLAGVLDAWGRLAAVYEEHVAAVGPDGDGAEDALRTLASVYHERLADVDRARATYGRLLERDRDDELAFINLEKLLERAQRWPELLDAYRDAAQNTLDLEVRRRLLHKAAAVAEQRLGDLDAAIQLQRAILDIDPGDQAAWAALDRLFQRGERWHDLAEHIERQIADRADVESAAGATGPTGPTGPTGLTGIEAWTTDKLRLADLRAGALADKPGALDLYEEILARRPNEARAVRALEKIIVEPEHTFRVAQVLGPIYRTEGSWQKLIVIYEAELGFLDDPERRIERLIELAALHEQRAGDRRRAFAALLRAWREESDGADEDSPREAKLFAELCRLAEAEQLFLQLCDDLEASVADSLDQGLRERIYHRVAQLAEVRLKDRARAIQALDKVLATNESDDAAWDALERLLAAEGRAKELVAALERRAGVSNDPDKRSAFHRRAAVVYEEALRDPAAAIGAWRLVLDIDADDQPAFSALARLYRSRGEHQELAEILDRQIATAQEAPRRRALRAELGALASGALGDAPRAADTWRGILADDPRDREAVIELRKLERAAAHYPELLETTDQLVELTPPGPEHDALRLEAAAIFEQHLSDVDAAVERYAALIGAEPGSLGTPIGIAARRELERLARSRDTRALAAAVLEPAYERAAEWSALMELGELAVEGEEDATVRRSWLLKMAQAAERGLSDGKIAFSIWARALHEEPADEETRAALERIAEAEAIPGELARVYEELLAIALIPEIANRVSFRLGELYEQRVGDEERAIVSYSRALETSAPAGDVDAERMSLVALDRLLSRAGRPRDLAEVLQRRAALADAEVEKVELLHRLGTILAGELVDLDGALSAFRDALELSPTHGPSRHGMEALLDSEPHREAALDVLEPLAERGDDVARQNFLSERRLLTLDDKVERGALLERIAERAEQALHDPTAAFGALARALALDPGSERLVEEVERIAGLRGQPGEAAALFERIVDEQRADLAPETRRSLSMYAGRAWEKSGAAERAEARYLAMLADERNDSDALEALERLYRVRGDAGRLADVLARRAAIELDVEVKKPLLAEAARLAEEALSDPDGAIELWRQVLALDEGDAAALSALGRLLETRSRWPELADLLAQAAGASSEPRLQTALLSRLAAISAERLRDLPRAIGALRELLDLEPEASAALDSLIELEARRGDDVSLKEALERKLGGVPAGPARIPLYRRLAEIAMRSDDASAIDDALGYLYEILALEPADAGAGEAQRALLERAERWNDLVDVLAGEATRQAAAGDTKAELATLVRAADIWEGKLQSPESAAEILDRILARDPRNVRALLSLARLAEGSGDTTRARQMLEGAETIAKEAGNGAELAELAYRRGRVEADAGDETAALVHYRRALVAEPTHAASLTALIERARAAGDAASLAQLLEAQLAATSAADATRAIRLELARLYLEKTDGGRDRARPHLEALLADGATPDSAQVTELLADLHFAAGRLDEARPLYTTLIAVAAQQKRRGKELARLHSRLGEIAEKNGDLAAALTALTEAQRLDAGHAPTLVALGRLLREKAEWESARKVYRSLLLQSLDAAAGISKAGVYGALGEIHEKLGEGPKAIGMYERGIELEPAPGPVGDALRAALARLRSG